jgi:MFS family permease
MGPGRYKWVALSNTTLGVLLATIDGSITLIALPDIFRGIRLDPLRPENSFYLLWMILGFLVVTSVLVLSLGRLGDLYGRVKMYNLGFVVYTISSLLLTIDWLSGTTGADWLIGFRLVQGLGAAFLLANSGAILTDAFPVRQRGMALGINNVVAISGMFIGLVLGGVLAPISWRLIFLVSVPFGAIGTVWSYRSLREIGVRRSAPIDWGGNLTFAGGLVLLMVGVTYGIRPYRSHAMGWASPLVVGCLAGGVALLAAFVFVELHIRDPMFNLALFRARAFTFGCFATLFSAVSRGGLMFMLIIWLQGIWLPVHGYSFVSTPLWAGIRMLPLTTGFLVSGPVFGVLSDRHGARAYATAGMIVSAITFGLFELLPIDFSYPQFATVLVVNGLAMGAFAAPNRAAVMNSLPAEHRGAGGAMNSTFQSAAQVLSIGVFFSLMIIGLASSLPRALATGLMAHGVPAASAAQVSHLPPVSVLFAAFLGYDPAHELIGPRILGTLRAQDAAAISDRGFFPHLISAPFHQGLQAAFAFAIAACVAAAAASLSRGGQFHAESSLDQFEIPENLEMS